MRSITALDGARPSRDARASALTGAGAATDTLSPMSTSPRSSFGRVDRNREYLALLSFLPLRSSARMPLSLVHTFRIMRPLGQARGLLGL